MKNIYTFLLMVLASLSASAYQATLEVDNPDAIKASIGGAPVVFTDGVAQIEYTSYDFVSIEAVEPYVLTGIQSCVPGSDSWVDGYLSSARRDGVSLSGEYTDGYKYRFSTGNLDELRTATVTLKVDDPSAIYFRRSWTDETFTPTEKETEIKYVPGKETPFAISTVSGKDLYKLTVNDTEISGYYGSYNIYEVNDGDVINVQAIFPEIDYDLVFNLSEGCREGFITSVKVDGAPIENWQNAKVRVASMVTVAFDQSSYRISKFDMNGTSIASYGNYFYSPYEFTMNENVTFDVEANPYGKVAMTIKVDKAEYVVVYKGYTYTDPANVFTLQDGESTIEIPEVEGTIHLRATPMATVTSVTQDGNPLSKDYSDTYDIEVREGSVIEVTAEEIRRDDTLVFYFDSPEKANDNSKELYGYSFGTEASRRTIELEAGYNVVKFGEVDGEFIFTVNNGKTDNIFFYINGEIPTYESEYMAHYFTPSNGDVLKCFVGERPAEYTLSFSLPEGMKAPAVTVDKITALTSLDEQKVLQGTCVTIVPAEGDTYQSVKVGEEVIAPVDGKYEFTVNADSPVTIEDEAAGIESVEASGNVRTVYNLQGVKVESETLPAGLYIINGKKTLIR